MIITKKSVGLKRATDPKRGNVQQFLDRLLVEVVSENYRYFLTEHLSMGDPPEANPEQRCWPPLLSNERQVSGLFAIGLSRVCPISVPEHPIARFDKVATDEEVATESRSGRIDFLAYFGNRSVAVELKRCCISTLGHAGEMNSLGKLWAEVENQSKEALVHMRKENKYYVSPVSIGLLVIRVGRKVTKLKSPEKERAATASLLPNIADRVFKLTKADYVSHYLAPAEMQVSFGWGNSEAESMVFPGVVFAAVVHERAK